MNKNAKRLIAGIAAFGISLTSIMSGVMSKEAYAYRLGGKDRYQTASLIAEKGWSKSEVAIVVRGDEFADALCAVPLARMYDAPILLTSKNTLSSETKNRIKNLGAKNVIIVGGTSAISEKVQKELASMAKVERIYGKSRYETSLKVAEKLGASKQVALVRGDQFADAMSIASYAALVKMPIILTGQKSLPKETKDYLNSSFIEKTFIVGGTGAISASVESNVKGADRISGKDRYDTNTKINEKFQNSLNFEKIYLALGQGNNSFADALAGSALAAKTASPVIITYNNLKDEQQDFLKGVITPKTDVVTLGGVKAVPEKITDSLKLSADEVKGDKSDLKVISNIKIAENNTSLNNSEVKGNVYVYGDGAKLKNVKIEGTLFLDPGENGNVTLDKVQAKNIRVLSGAKNSIHLNEVTSNALIVNSKNESSSTRVVVEKGSKIGEAYLLSETLLENNKGDLNTVVVSTVNEEKVTLKGLFKYVQVVKEGNVDVAGGTTVTNSITLSAPASLNVESGAKVGAVIANLVSGEIAISGSGSIDLIALDNNLGNLKVNGTLTVGEILALSKDNVKLSDNLASKLTVGKMADINVKLDAIIKAGDNSYNNNVNNGSITGPWGPSVNYTKDHYTLKVTGIDSLKPSSISKDVKYNEKVLAKDAATGVLNRVKTEKDFADTLEKIINNLKKNYNKENVARLAKKIAETNVEKVPTYEYLNVRAEKYAEKYAGTYVNADWKEFVKNNKLSNNVENNIKYISDAYNKFLAGKTELEKIKSVNPETAIKFAEELEKDLQASKIPNLLSKVASIVDVKVTVNGNTTSLKDNADFKEFTIANVKKLLGLEGKTVDTVTLNDLAGKKLEVKFLKGGKEKTVSVEFTKYSK